MILRRSFALCAAAATVAATVGCATSDSQRCRQSIEVTARPSIPVGEQPLDVAIGDVNGDGALDIASADAKSARVTVALGRGDGTFQETTRAVDVGLKPHLVALADLDRDRDLDLIATDHDSAFVAVWLGDGRGGFASAPGAPFRAHDGKPHNHGLLVADVSSDGIADVITTNQEGQSVSVLLGDGTGRLTSAAASPVVLGADAYPSAIADLDGDGKLDLAVPLVGGTAVAVLRGDGKGGFLPMPGAPYATLARPYSIRPLDIDLDGSLDLLVAHDDTDSVTVLRGGANGRFTPAQGSPFSAGARLFGMAPFDVNRDGAMDLVAGAGNVVLALMARKGSALPQVCRTDLAVNSYTVKVADLDRDGRLDIVAPDAKANVVRVWTSRR
jgi:hypothetical protein